MSRTKGDGAKHKLRFTPAKHDEIVGPENWIRLQTMLKTKLPPAARKRIQDVCSIYASIGATHEGRQVVNSKDALKALNKWHQATGRLRVALGQKSSVASLSRAKIIAKCDAAKMQKRLERSPMLSLINFFASLAMGAALTIINDPSVEQYDPTLRRELWFAWAKVIALVLASVGVKPTASNSSHHPSRFLKAILYLQDLLPSYCQMHRTEAAAAGGIHKANKQFKGADEAFLYAYLVAVGSGQIRSQDLSGIIDKVRELSSRADFNLNN
jgi:hypothetical protein